MFDFRAGVDADGTYRGTLRSTGLRPRFIERLNDRGIQVPPETFRLQEAGR
jgi:pilus assembly protein CpaF